MTGFNPQRLRDVARSRGYNTDAAIVAMMARLFNLTTHIARRRLLSDTWVRFDESFAVASFLRMTPKEYADVFLEGLFIEDDTGHFIAHVDNEDTIADSKNRNVISMADRVKARRKKEREIREREEIERLKEMTGIDVEEER